MTPAIDEQSIDRDVADTRDSRSASLTLPPGRYIVTAMPAGQELAVNFWRSMKMWERHTGGKIIILLMEGHHRKDEFTQSCAAAMEVGSIYATSVRFNDNLIAADFRLKPQMINPLTGLDEYGQKEFSLIVAHTKQNFKTVPVRIGALPHIITSTGACTLPDYYDTRVGRMATQSHKIGALVVEVTDDQTYHLRHVTARPDGDFYDLDMHYHPDKVTQGRARALIVGDIHFGWTADDALAATLDQVNTLRPRYVFLHDAFDGSSVSHHNAHNIHARLKLPFDLQTLDRELDVYTTSLCRFAAAMPPDCEVFIVRSNHDEHLDRYLYEGRFTHDDANYELAVELSKKLAQGINPLEYYAKKWAPAGSLENVTWLDRTSSVVIENHELAMHGDKGVNGSRGSVQQFSRAMGRVIVGHGHGPQRYGNAVMVGTSTIYDLPYTAGAPSSWLHTNACLYRGGGVALLNEVRGRWRKSD